MKTATLTARERQHLAGAVQFLRAAVETKGDVQMVPGAVARLYPKSLHAAKIKAAVTPGTTFDALFGGPLAQYSQAFAAYLRNRTVIGRMPELRTMPFREKVVRATGGSTTGWIGPNVVIPVTSASFETVTPAQGKLASIIAMTDEMARFADPDADKMLREDLAAASTEAMDVSFLDPSVATIPNVRPASITFGAPSVASTGTFATDFKNLLNLITSEMIAPYLIMRPRVAAALAALDTQLTRNVGPLGGEIATIPVLTTASAPMDADSPAANVITLIDADSVFISDAGISIDTSRNATIQMQTTPDSPPVQTTVQTSLYQNNLIGLRLIRYLNWMPRRTGGVAQLTGVEY